MATKKKSEPSPLNVPMRLWATKDALNRAWREDENLEKFTVEVDGHTLTFEQVHHWINCAAQEYEQKGPRAQAERRLLRDLEAAGASVRCN